VLVEQQDIAQASARARPTLSACHPRISDGIFARAFLPHLPAVPNAVSLFASACFFLWCLRETNVLAHRERIVKGGVLNRKPIFFPDLAELIQPAAAIACPWMRTDPSQVSPVRYEPRTRFCRYHCGPAQQDFATLQARLIPSRTCLTPKGLMQVLDGDNWRAALSASAGSVAICSIVSMSYL